MRRSASMSFAPRRYLSMNGRNPASCIIRQVGVASRLCEPSNLMISLARGIQVGIMARKRHQRRPVGEPDAVAPFVRMVLRRAHRALREHRVAPQFAEHLLCGRAGVADRLGHRGRQPPGKFQLGLRPHHGLLHDVRIPAPRHHLVVDLDVAVDENPVARNLDIVEDQKRILFIEARRQRMVEAVRVPAQLSRQMNFSPGVAIGMQNDSANLSPSSGSGRPGYTASSSANGASVDRMRAPRTTMPCSVSPPCAG